MEKQWNSLEEYLAARRAYQEKLARIGEERKAYLAQQPKLSPEEAYQEFKKTYGHEEEEEIEANNLSDNLSIHRHLMELMNEEEDEPKVKKESVWEKFRKNLEVFIDLPTGEWDGKPKQKQQN